MLPMPAITCWSSSSGLSRVRRPASSGLQRRRRRGRRRAGRRRGGPARAARRRRGRGRTRRPRRTCADRRTTAPRPASRREPASARRGCAAGAARPPAASSSWPVIRRCTITVSPVSSGSSRYLPRRLGGEDRRPVSPSITAWADVRRTVRSPPDLDPLDRAGRRRARRARAGRSRPRAARARPAGRSAGVPTTGGASRRGGRGACSAAFFERPVPSPSTSPSTTTAAKNRLAWSGPSAGATYSGGRRRPSRDLLLERATCGRGGRGGRPSRPGAGRSAARRTS